jgi:alkanesulfonate monooxygenase SsuD/methylene tetrahydromethanopterin reductase-like flavin-dependent oxidoreductase (luciferase family)
MHFGLFGGAQAPRTTDGDPGRGFWEFIETSVEAERLGFHSTFLVEHHFSGSGQVSAPLDLLSWVAARTTSIRVGTALLVLPWHDPVLLAERAATLDLLSGGRLDFGVGKGYRPSEFAGFRVPTEEAEARFDESLAVILQAWSSDEPFSHEVRFWHYHGIVVEPPTAQKPHPPVWIAAGKPASVRKVAALGQQARVHGRMIERSRDPGGSKGSHVMAYANTAGATEAHARFGPPPEIIAGLQALQAVGARYVLISGGEARESMQRFAAEVMPAFLKDS